MKERIMYATKKGEPDWKEQIITTDESAFAPAREWAEKNGFDRIRIATINLSEVPNFGATVNI